MSLPIREGAYHIMLDLHTHSTMSDGTLRPAELIEEAVRAGLTAIALTDHDSIAGLEEFLAAAAGHPELCAIPGIEFSCCLEKGDHCHMVGLFVDGGCPRLRGACEQYVRWRDERNAEMVRRLNGMGYALTLEEVLACRSVPGVVGRPHIAAALVERGYVRTQREAFDTLIGRGRPAYVPRFVLPARECLDTIHAAGGLAIWAHPMTRDNMTVAKCERIILELAQHRLDGIEAHYSEHSPTQVRNVLTLARKHGLLVSGGSDFHGQNRPGIRLGVGYGGLHVPDALLDEMRKESTKYASHTN